MSTGATILEVQQRIIALCELMTLPTTNPTPTAYARESQCSFADEALPAFIVLRGPGRHVWIATDTRQTTREYLLKLVVQRVCDDPKPECEEDALELAAQCIEPVLDWFGARPGLGLDVEDEGIADDSTILQDAGDNAHFTYNSRKYSGVLFRMQVITRHQLGEEEFL